MINVTPTLNSTFGHSHFLVGSCEKFGMKNFVGKTIVMHVGKSRQEVGT